MAPSVPTPQVLSSSYRRGPWFDLEQPGRRNLLTHLHPVLSPGSGQESAEVPVPGQSSERELSGVGRPQGTALPQRSKKKGRHCSQRQPWIYIESPGELLKL